MTETPIKLILPEGFSAGFGRETVNPEPGCGLSGYGTDHDRLATRLLDDIMISCTALSDGEKVFLFFSCDVLLISEEVAGVIMERLEKQYGIPPAHIVVNATHTHSAPSVIYPKAPGMAQYRPRFFDGAEKAAATALADLAPAKAYAATTETDTQSYVRRYISTTDGSFLGNWPGPLDPDDARHETAADPNMRLLRFVREGKKDIVMVNWQCHPCTASVSGSKKTEVSAEWICTMRSMTEENLGVHFVYHQGAAGNVISASSLIGEKSNLEHNRLGRELYWRIKHALSWATPVKTGPFRACRHVLAEKRNADWMERMKTAQDSENLPLTTLSIGDVAFATVPCEWNDTCGRAVREASPFKMTFICSCTNGSVSYIPASFCWENGGYEVMKCHFDKGMGEKLVRHHLSKLYELYE